MLHQNKRGLNRRNFDSSPPLDERRARVRGALERAGFTVAPGNGWTLRVVAVQHKRAGRAA